MSEDKCYYCGKAVGNEDLIMKNVSTGMFSSERKPFHKEHWKTYHATKMKKDAIEYIALADGAFLLFGGAVLFLIGGILGYVILASCIAILIGLGYAWFKLEK